MKFIVLMAFLFSVTTAAADGFMGLWTTVDDETKEKKDDTATVKKYGTRISIR